jgi:hypothetical protein
MGSLFPMMFDSLGNSAHPVAPSSPYYSFSNYYIPPDISDNPASLSLIPAATIVNFSWAGSLSPSSLYEAYLGDLPLDVMISSSICEFPEYALFIQPSVCLSKASSHSLFPGDYGSMMLSINSLGFTFTTYSDLGCTYVAQQISLAGPPGACVSNLQFTITSTPTDLNSLISYYISSNNNSSSNNSPRNVQAFSLVLSIVISIIIVIFMRISH